MLKEEKETRKEVKTEGNEVQLTDEQLSKVSGGKGEPDPEDN